ncbi:MAG: HAMP domain-containing histidine kinase, partial [Coriobacteriia bacterium]|nr:HAMP domain-containing histidine kinase [Coriobacteriia bacterium]
FGRNAIKPLNDLSKGLNEVASGNFTVRLNEQTLGQYSETSRNFNQMARELESIEMLREDFILNVSHEFKTPLSAIQGYATLLQDPDLGEAEKAEYLDGIFSATRSLSNLSSNILELSNLETQASELSKEEYSLDEQLRQVIVMLEPACSKKGLELEVDLDTVDIIANQDLLETVWINLLGNAIKFTEEGGSVTVRMRCLDKQTGAARASSPASKVEVSIADTGCGIEEKELSRIFDKFYQTDQSHKSEGNGLGLALVNTIIAKHNGSIEVQSTPGKGSCFRVHLCAILSPV